MQNSTNSCPKTRGGYLIKFPHYHPLGKMIYISPPGPPFEGADQETFEAHMPFVPSHLEIIFISV